jgi:hypothetical protein
MPRDVFPIEKLYEDAFRSLGTGMAIPEVHVSFHPYVGINHTIRVRSGKAFVRISDICQDMPLDAHRSLAHILVGKLLRKRIPRAVGKAYSDYVKTPEIREKAAENKKLRGRKIVSGSSGHSYDLDEIFDALNARYFRGSLAKPVLTWSARRTYRILGHHDATHDTIVVSRSLDAADVPRYVVEYILFHEMLHIHHPTEHRHGRRYNHTPAFRRDEARFQHYREAEDWIESNVRRLKRNARRQS